MYKADARAELIESCFYFMAPAYSKWEAGTNPRLQLSRFISPSHVYFGTPSGA